MSESSETNVITTPSVEAVPCGLPVAQSCRPQRYDQDIAEEVANLLLPRVKEWMGKDRFEDDEILEQLADAINDNIGHDGYELARDLERDHYWEADAALVDIMEMVSSKVYSVWSNKCKTWVQANNIQPTLKVGDRVQWDKAFSGKSNGSISGIKTPMAQYVIHEDGQSYPHSKPASPLGLLLYYEDVQPEAVQPEAVALPT